MGIFYLIISALVLHLFSVTTGKRILFKRVTFRLSQNVKTVLEGKFSIFALKSFGKLFLKFLYHFSTGFVQTVFMGSALLVPTAEVLLLSRSSIINTMFSFSQSSSSSSKMFTDCGL